MLRSAARSGGGHLDRNGGDLEIVQPLDPARASVARDFLAIQIGSQLFQVELEIGRRGGAPPDLRHRGIASADPEHGTPPALYLQSQCCRGGDGGIATHRVRDTCADLDALRGGRCEHQLAPDLRRHALGVGEDETVEAQLFRHPRCPGGTRRAWEHQ
jgi:hypothetical protein